MIMIPIPKPLNELPGLGCYRYEWYLVFRNSEPEFRHSLDPDPRFCYKFWGKMLKTEHSRRIYISALSKKEQFPLRDSPSIL